MRKMPQTFCISLPDRVDRRNKVLQSCDEIGLRPRWIQAVDGRNGIGGAMGCKYSHWFCIKLAQHEQLGNFLVIEDDVQFSKDFSLDIEDVPEDWDMVYFGGNHVRGKPTHIKNNVYKCTYTLCTHAMLIRHTCYDLLLKRLLDSSDPVDVTLGKLHRYTLNAYVIYPHTAWQVDGYSDIENREVNYSFLKDRPI